MPKKVAKKKAVRRSRAKRPPTLLYALYDEKGEFCGAFTTPEEAFRDAWGPRFKKHRVVAYSRGLAVKERDLKPDVSSPNQLWP